MSGERIWTQNQLNAIKATKGSVLVSAAAGSGKTAVLVERVVKMITDAKFPVDADRLLIVTFTNAAAAEMRERIFSRVSEIISENPENRNLQRQQILLTKTKICTIHSFCSDLIREYFYKLGISSEFKIIDENEVSIMKEDAINNVLEKRYKSGSKQFHLLVETFSNAKDDSHLVEIIKELYEFSSAHPYPEIWFESQLNFYRSFKNIKESPWGKVLFKYVDDVIKMCLELTESSLDVASSGDEKLFQAFEPILKSDYEQINFINTSDWNSIVKSLKNLSFKVLRAPRGYKDDPVKLLVAQSRDEVKSMIKKLKSLFLISEEECRNDVVNLFGILSELFDVVRDFSSELYNLKLEKNVLDFSDLEHLTVKLLANPIENEFQKTEDAVSISQRFDEIMVDEYQDTNETQDLIFRMISNDEKNLFVVGDVKQSIYGFRQAMPEIFIKRKESYKKYDLETQSYPAKIILEKNFRSCKGITDAVNFVFGQIMSREVGDIDYSEEEKLVASNEDQNPTDMQVDVIDLESSFEGDMDEVEAKYVADIIRQKMSDGFMVKEGNSQRPLKFGDCCVLLRSTKSHAQTFVNELEKNNVPAWCESGGSFLSATEICVMISLLRVIDNPVQDIPLMSVLMSPLAMFTANDIASIRLEKRNVPLYFALKEFAEKTQDTHLKKFLSQIDNYRYMAATMSCSKLISYIYEKTDFESIVQTMKNGDRRLANLRMLVSYAKTYEQSGYKGVSDFIRFIDRLQTQNSDLLAPALSMEDSVKVMSIHRSKGLEFPVCIIANCSRKFNKDRGDLLLNSELGVGIKLRNVEKLYAYTNFIRDAISLEIDRAEVSEEMRILYVAMTRAKQNLIMICSLKNVEKKILSYAAKISDNEKLSPYVARSSTSFSDWILMCALKNPSASQLRALAEILPGEKEIRNACKWTVNILSIAKEEEIFEEKTQETLSQTNTIDEKLLSDMKKKFDFRYPLSSLEGIPAKISVSDLIHKSEDSTLSRPAFMNDYGMTAAEKGTALHAFMQFADFNKAKVSLDDHIDFLVQKKFLTKEQSLAIDKTRVQKFLQSSIANRIITSKNILREFRFNVNLKANRLNSSLPSTYDNEYVVLQGAIDCAFEEDGEFVIVDYKTDRVQNLEELAKKYSKQLSLYKEALEESTKQKVKECLIYSFCFNDSCIAKV